jgi:outer membrane protein
MTQRRFAILTSMFVLAASCHAAQAADTADTAGAAAAREGNLPLWEAGVGVAAFNTPAYPGAQDRSRRLLALPILLYRGRVLRADQEGIGARLIDNDRIEFDIGFAAALPARSKDVAERQGMPDLGTLIEFGPRIKYHLADLGDAGRLHAELALRTPIELHAGVRRQGWTLEPRLVWEQRGDGGRWTAAAQLAAIAGDRRINGYFYDVAPQYATPERPAYHAGSGLMLVRTGLTGTFRLNPDVRLFSFVRFDSYASSSNRDSPLLRRNTGASVGIGFAWTLARSAQRAAD